MEEDAKLSFEASSGGCCGGNLIVKIGTKYLGHLYIDASDGVDVDVILAAIADAYNNRSADN